MASAEIKVEKDIEEVRALIKDIDTIKSEFDKIESIWNAYNKSVPAKNIGDDPLGVILNELLDKKYRYFQNSDGNQFNKDKINENGDNSLRMGLFSSERQADTSNVAGDNIRASFKANLKLLLKQLHSLRTKYKNKKDTDKENEYTSVINKITTADTDEYATIIDDLLTLVAISTTATPNRNTITAFINAAKELHNAGGNADEYTPTERKNIETFFKQDINGIGPFFKPVTTSQELITTAVKNVLSKLTDIASRYSVLDTRIRTDVLEQLKPKDISASSKITILNNVASIVAKFTEDYKVHMNIRAVSGGGSRRKKIIQRGGADDRNEITREFTEAKNNIVLLKTIASDLYKGLNRFSNPEMGDSSKGEDSIFNKLFEKYMKTKDDTTTGGPFVASTELINDLKSNDLYPDEVLQIDMRDKFIFVAVTLFMRIISLMIIETIIDRKIITRMDTAIFWYGITMTLFIIVFVLLVNFDSYKLRIIFNYVNFHIGYSTTFSYIFQLWIFGGMVYYIMLKINDDVISSASNDEDRARLKHKVQVISMITWFFLSIGVLVM
jgi:hypothetical protein